MPKENDRYLYTVALLPGGKVFVKKHKIIKEMPKTYMIVHWDIPSWKPVIRKATMRLGRDTYHTTPLAALEDAKTLVGHRIAYNLLKYELTMQHSDRINTLLEELNDAN